jgi:hypothetical protein
MRRFRTCVVVLAIGLLPCAVRAQETRAQKLYIQQDIVHDRNAPGARTDDFLDTTFHVAWPHMNASLTLGSFDMGAEWGGFVRDRRGSAYGLSIRRRFGGWVENTSLQLETLQKLGRTVLGASAKLFWPDDPAQGETFSAVPGATCEVYYGDYSFASLRVSHDPRPDTGTTFRLTNRLAGERHSVELALAPRTDGAVSWGIAARYGFLAAGLASENDYDFTDIDRLLVFFGFHYDLVP